MDTVSVWVRMDWKISKRLTIIYSSQSNAWQFHTNTSILTSSSSSSSLSAPQTCAECVSYEMSNVCVFLQPLLSMSVIVYTIHTAKCAVVTLLSDECVSKISFNVLFHSFSFLETLLQFTNIVGSWTIFLLFKDI